mgnify:CR=1 FL=1
MSHCIAHIWTHLSCGELVAFSDLRFEKYIFRTSQILSVRYFGLKSISLGLKSEMPESTRVFFAFYSLGQWYTISVFMFLWQSVILSQEWVRVVNSKHGETSINSPFVTTVTVLPFQKVSQNEQAFGVEYKMYEYNIYVYTASRSYWYTSVTSALTKLMTPVLQIEREKGKLLCVQYYLLYICAHV